MSGIRYVEVLTTASAVANFLGEPDVQAQHVASAIRILREELTLDDLGRPVSPLIPRRGHGGSSPEVRAFAQRWYGQVGNDPHTELTHGQLEQMLSELDPAPQGESPIAG